MRKLLFLLPILALFVASEALAGFTDCAGIAGASTAVTDLRVFAGTQLCYDFNDATDSGAFTVETESALVCFDPDEATAGAATGQCDIRYCLTTTKPGANADRNCQKVNSTTPLVGADDGTGNNCTRIGRGVYYVDVTTSSAGDEARVHIHGDR